MGLKIKLNSIMVENQDKALKFYTEVLGFVKGRDIPVGAGFRWITVISPEGHPDVELALEPNQNPAGKTFQTALFQQNIPATAFEVSDMQAEFARLKAQGVVFTMEPMQMGLPGHSIKLAVFADTCGNLIQIYQPLAE
jgi:catechol 2,3-dioxygenase-like lactoylglutathione lyase family enzyme